MNDMLFTWKSEIYIYESRFFEKYQVEFCLDKISKIIFITNIT